MYEKENWYLPFYRHYNFSNNRKIRYYATNNEFMIEQEKVALKDGAIVYGNSTDDYSLCLK